MKATTLNRSFVPSVYLKGVPFTPVMGENTTLSVFWYTLVKMLTLKRPSEAAGEAQAAAYLVLATNGDVTEHGGTTMIDGAGNVHVDLRQAGRAAGDLSRTLFTSHIDTQHREDGVATLHQTKDGAVFAKDDLGNCVLGADDGAGIALMCHMISHGVAGYYIFFRGEEIGGIGSSWLAQMNPDFLCELDRAIAFDRGGFDSIITHQSGGRCCSDEFAQALGTALSTEKDWFCPDSTGTYTDTAEFIDLIPECTNVSVGYKRQHGPYETLDVAFLERLALRLLKVDWEALPVVRDPVEGAVTVDELEDIDRRNGFGASGFCDEEHPIDHHRDEGTKAMDDWLGSTWRQKGFM